MSHFKQVIILGAPGSGKGTQSANIIEAHNLRHLSTGDILRSEIANKTLLGQKAKSVMDSGNLVSDEIILGMVESQVNQYSDTGFLFDGFPRTINQAIELDKLLEKHGKTVTHVIQLEVSEDEIVDRMLSRGRDDDNPETVKNRINVYKEQTAPLIDYYREQNKIHTVQGSGDVSDITKTILEKLENN